MCDLYTWGGILRWVCFKNVHFASVSRRDVAALASPLTYTTAQKPKPCLAFFVSRPCRLPSANQGSLSGHFEMTRNGQNSEFRTPGQIACTHFLILCKYVQVACHSVVSASLTWAHSVTAASQEDVIRVGLNFLFVQLNLEKKTAH